MKNLVILVITFAISAAGLESCGGVKSLSSATQKKDSVKHVQLPSSFIYKFYLEAFGLEDRPHDQIWIDTTGQITYDTDQHMTSGEYKHLRGYAYLEPKDEDTLLAFIKDTTILYIDESDVTPQCPKGDQYVFQLWRSDKAKQLGIHSNSCASEFNLLTGIQRKRFPKFLQFISRFRDRYRVAVVDTGK